GYVRARFFFPSIRRHTRFSRDWSSDVCSSDLAARGDPELGHRGAVADRGLGGGEGAFAAQFEVGLARQRACQGRAAPVGHAEERSEDRRVGGRVRYEVWRLGRGIVEIETEWVL